MTSADRLTIKPSGRSRDQYANDLEMTSTLKGTYLLTVVCLSMRLSVRVSPIRCLAKHHVERILTYLCRNVTTSLPLYRCCAAANIATSCGGRNRNQTRSDGALKMQDRKMQDWKMTDKSAEMENAKMKME